MKTSTATSWGVSCYDKPEPSDDDSDDQAGKFASLSCEVGCQTPREWLSLRPAQEAKEAAPGRAPPRKYRPLEPGMTTPERVLNTKRIHEYSLEY